jgi:hypothetical protein
MGVAQNYGLPNPVLVFELQQLAEVVAARVVDKVWVPGAEYDFGRADVERVATSLGTLPVERVLKQKLPLVNTTSQLIHWDREEHLRQLKGHLLLLAKITVVHGVHNHHIDANPILLFDFKQRLGLSIGKRIE